MSKKATGILAALTIAAAAVTAFFLSDEKNRAKVKAGLNKARKEAGELADDIMDSDEVEQLEKEAKQLEKEAKAAQKKAKSQAEKVSKELKKKAQKIAKKN